uniref:Cyclic nucleotide-binding domain-containing protein n=1 Tax=Elaeophora elaphi TaxID=1147741 RepID=A0A0R3RVK4_9BILA
LQRCKSLRSNKVCDTNEQENCPPATVHDTKWHYLRKKWVLDTKDEFYYYWLSVVSCAFAYNLIVVIATKYFELQFYFELFHTTIPICCFSNYFSARSVFNDLASGYYWILWLVIDFVMDIIYVVDMFVRSRTGFLEQGLLVRDISRITKLYLKSLQFKLDIISVLPFDLILSLIFLQSFPYMRFNRIIRYPRFSDFVDRTETRSSMPNAFRIFCVIANIIVIIHWNACLYFYISAIIGLGSDGWVYGRLNKQSLPDGVEDTLARRYIYSFYWSTLILTTIGEVPGPKRNMEFLFVIMDLMCGVLIFATIVGNVGSAISNMGEARTKFQNKMDGIKQYMKLRKVNKELEMRVIKWFDYLWEHKQSLSDQRVLKILPDKLQTEIAMQVHYETLRRVRIFQDCEAGLLAELVLKLQQQIFSPGDYICKKGDIGREMYIVKRGKLQVVADDGIKVFATLQEGAVFGELSILNIAGSKNGNRRTANVRSVGYTDLFALNKNDLWTALKEYPDARKLLIAKGREILRKDGLLDEDATEEQMTAEEMAKSLQNTLKIMQTKMARFAVEFKSVKSKLLARIEYLETELAKYQTNDNSANLKDDYRIE